MDSAQGHPELLDALAALRRTLWTERIIPMTGADPPDLDKTRNLDVLLDTLAYAA
ncbi:MAG: hypothetical protein ABI903_16070 [Actinomycetota bacterium]